MMVDNGNIGENARNINEEQVDPPAVPPRPKLPEEAQQGNVSTLNRCQTSDAKRLCIYNVHVQKDVSERHDIGGTYAAKTPEFWFYYTSTMRPKCFMLLNLFVCHRKPGSFSIAVPNSNQFTLEDKVCTFTNPLTLYYFRSTQNNESHYIKTFHFPLSRFDLGVEITTVMVNIPLNIRVEPLFTLNKDVLDLIKLQHSLNNNFSEQNEADFIIKSDSGKEYPVHRILLAAHSSVLRQLIKDNKSLFVDTSDSTIELLLHYIYTGTVKEAGKRNVSELLEIVHKFQLKPLLILVNHLIDREISVHNAVEMALVAKKYKLDDVQQKVYRFIKNNPEVIDSDGWKKLDDVELAKAIFQYALTNKLS